MMGSCESEDKPCPPGPGEGGQRVTWTGGTQDLHSNPFQPQVGLGSEQPDLSDPLTSAMGPGEVVWAHWADMKQASKAESSLAGSALALLGPPDTGHM